MEKDLPNVSSSGIPAILLCGIRLLILKVKKYTSSVFKCRPDIFKMPIIGK
jgi:hypothetical protein